MTPGRDTPEGSRTVPRALGATWALGVVAQTWATSMLTTDHDEPRLLAFLVACSAVTAVAGVVSARLSPVRWGEHAKPLAAAEAVTWLVLVLVGTALLVILPLLAPSDEQTVRLALAWSSCIVPAVAGVAALRRVRRGRSRTVEWRSGWALGLTLAGAVVVLVLTRLA